MAIDRQGTGLAILRIAIGVFFTFEAIGKFGWLTSSSHLAAQLTDWSAAAAPGSVSAWYLHRIALPGAPYFARLVPLGEFISGLALLVGFGTPLFAFLAFL